MRWLAVLVLCLQILTSPGSVKYCGSRMCGHTDEHTFCRYSGPGLSCTGYIHVPLSYEEKSRILGRLNRRRHDIALGLNDWPPAADMLKLQWVEELSREAQLWADQCRPPHQIEEHDLCRDLYSTNVGQCVASIVGEAPGLRPETMVDIWYMQRVSYEGNFTSYLPPVTSTEYYEDFGQMVWSRTYMVGCGRSRFMAPLRGRLRSVERLVCNFAPRGPASSRALWTLGPPASMCPSRSRPDHHLTGLCTFQSNLNVSDDKFNKLSTKDHLLLDTMLEVECNDTHYIGSFDEYYLKQVAISNLSLSPTDAYSFLNKREIIEELDQFNETTAQYLEIDINNVVTSKREKKKKITILGRYKSFDLDELEDVKTENSLNVLLKETTHTNELYADLEYLANIYDTNNDLSISASNTTFDITHLLTNGSRSNTSVERDTLVDNMSSWKTVVGNTTDYTKRDELDEYLADPETYRQLQAALERMENNLAGPNTTVGKVRRDLRAQPNNTLINRDQQNVIPDEQAEIERNRTLDRNPMLNMVLKYMPYLKPYEKTIMGDATGDGEIIFSNVFALLCPMFVILC